MTIIHLTDSDSVSKMFPESNFVKEVGSILYLLAKDGDPDIDSYAVVWKSWCKSGKCQAPKKCDFVVLTDNDDLCSLFRTVFTWAREKCRSIGSVKIKGMTLHLEANWDDDDDEKEERETPAKRPRVDVYASAEILPPTCE